MTMNAGTLEQEINEAGCPTETVTVIDGNDRSTWSFTVPAGTPQDAIDRGNNVIATIPIDPLNTTCATEEFIARWTNQEYLKLEAKRASDIAANKIGLAKDWDVVIAAPSIDFNRKKVESLKADLVANGILTQARADEIFV